MKKIIFLIMTTLLCSCSNSESNFSEKDLKLIIDGRITSRGCNNFDRLISSSGKISGIENEILAVSYIVHGCGGTLFYPDFIIIDKVSKKILSSPSLDATKIGDIKAIKIKDNLLAIESIGYKDEDARCCPSDTKEFKLVLSNYVQGGKLDSRAMTKGIEDGINQASTSKLNDDPYNPITMRKKFEEAYRKNTRDLDALKAKMPSNKDIDEQLNDFINKYRALYTPNDFIKQLFQNVTDVRVAEDIGPYNGTTKALYDILPTAQYAGKRSKLDVSVTCESIILSGYETYSNKNMVVKLVTKDIDYSEIFSRNEEESNVGKYIPCKKSIKCAYQETTVGRGNTGGDGLAIGVMATPSNDSIYDAEWEELHNNKNYDFSRLSNFSFRDQLNLLESKRLYNNRPIQSGPFTYFDAIVKSQFSALLKSCS